MPHDDRPPSAHIIYRPQYFIPTAVAVIYNEYQFNCLFVKSRHNGRWMLPRATMLPGESAEETAMRAALELTGLNVLNPEPFIADSGKYARVSGQPHAHMIRFGFRFNQWNGKLRTSTADTVDARFIPEYEMYDSLNQRHMSRSDIANLSDDDWCIYEDHRATIEREVPAEHSIVWVR